MAGKIDQRMKEITERLEQGVKTMFTSEMYTKYLQIMSQFHNYSFNNTLLIALQKPEATLVAGYQAWQKFNRQVKRGEKGIQIIAPAPIREKEVIEKVDPVTHELILRPDGQPETEEVVHVIPRFRVTTVFDVSQTYGEALPELETPELMGNVENYEIFMQAIREVSPVPIRFDGIKGESKGFYSNTNKEIVIREGMSESQTMKTAVHEVTHAKLHDRDIMEELGDRKDRTTKEVEAESVAYTVCQYFGLDTSDYSFPYIAGWSSDRDMKELRTSMDTIRKTAGEFIDSMTEVMQRLLREQPQHLKEDDLVLEYTLPSEEGESYFVVQNMEKAELLVQLHSYHELYGESREKEIDTFLQEQGAEVIPWYDSHGLQVENPVTFYDVIYHGENGLVADAAGYPPVIQAALLMDRAEYGEKFLSDPDKLLVTRYAEKIADMDKVKALLRDFEAAAQAPDSRLTEEVRQTAQAEMEGKDLSVELEKSESAIGRNNENLYLTGNGDRYAIYQIADGTKGRDYQFMSMDFITSHDMAVDAADYRFVYGGRLTEQDTLDSLYEKFNVGHPEGYTGHSLSMSDVVVLQRNGEAKAYYVDRLGFTDLPDFIPQRLHEAEMNRKREDSRITLDTSGVEIEQHEGLWHTVDKMEIGDEIFYLMKHNEYGDSAAAVIVNADGELVAQELENGFDRGALEAIREYLAGKGIAWEPEAQEKAEEKVEEKAEEKAYPPVYRESLTYAMEHAAVDEYLDSRKLNIDCRRAVENAIRDNFDGMHLADNVMDSVLEEYGSERLSFVLACTVQHNSWDGRFSRDTKAWAEGISVPENIDRGRDMNLDYVVESHPAVLDGFIGMAREKFRELEQVQEQSEPQPFIVPESDDSVTDISGESLQAVFPADMSYYVVNDAYGVKAEREYQYFPDLASALTAYAALPNYLDKQIGMESTENPPSRMSLINCRNGIEELNDIKSVSLSGKWINAETEEALGQAKGFLKEHDPEIAYQMGSRYFFIQAIPEGYDYTFYNTDFSDIDGGILDQPRLPIRQAINEIVEDFAGDAHPPLKVIDAVEFREKVEAVEKEAIEQRSRTLTADMVTGLKGRRHEYDAGVRETVYEFDCLVDGKPAVLTYTTGRREHFSSPLSDRGDMEEVFSIHTDGEDIWDRMPEPELEKLEARLAGEAETFLIEEQIEAARSITELKEVSYTMMEREFSAMNEAQRTRAWDGMNRKGMDILKTAISAAGSREEIQKMRNSLAETGGILNEEQQDDMAEAVKEKAAELAVTKPVPLISDMKNPEKSLNWKSRADIEETVLCFAQARIEEMGLADEVKLLGARVYGSRTRSSLAKDGSDVDVALSYTGNIPENAFFNALHENGLEIACLPINITPVSIEKTGTLEDFMDEEETFLDWAEAHKLADEIDRFAHDYDPHNYENMVDDRQVNVMRIEDAILQRETSELEDWLHEVIHESRDPEKATEAKGFMQSMIDQTDGQRYTVCGTEDSYEEPYTVFDRVNGDYYQDKDGFTPLFLTGQEAQAKVAEINEAFQAGRDAQMAQEPKISFYVAECMEYPVLGEYHNNLTLQEAAEIYHQIRAERVDGIKGIGFRLEDGSEYDGEFTLMSAGVINKEAVNSIPHYKESPLVQKAIADLETIMEKEKGMESRTEPVKNGQEQARGSIDGPVSENVHETAAEPERPQKSIPETDRGDGNGGGRKQSVLQALRERQAKLKAQESQKPEKEPKAHKKGEQEL